MPFSEEFFLGAWHPFKHLRVTLRRSTPPANTISGDNWFLLGSRAPDGKACLVHPTSGAEQPATTVSIAFRGYVVNPPVHSWSDSGAVASYWREPLPPFNGVFAAARVWKFGSALDLISDAFGVSPLYYREVEGLVLFATNPRLLAMGGDVLDGLVGRIVVHCGYAWGNRGLTVGIRKVPPGCRLTFANGSARESQWFHLAQLPGGTEPVTRQNLHDLEAAFQVAVSRLLDLNHGMPVLPLSGGNDSRRILAALHSRRIPTAAYTVRVFHGGRDMDSVFAGNLARHFGFSHEIIQLPLGSKFGELDHLRRVLVDGEGVEHTWWLPLSQRIGTGPALVFDGLRGDVNALTSYGVHDVVRPLSAEIDVLNASWWPKLDAVREYLADYLSMVPPGPNYESLAFTALRTRSGPGLMATRLLQAGSVPVFPFMDLEYLHQSVRFMPDPEVERRRSLQALCLEEFWPEFASFPSTRNPPPVQPRHLAVEMDQLRESLRKLNQESGYPLYRAMRRALGPKGLVLAACAARSGYVARRVRWWVVPVLTLFSRQALLKPVWTLEAPDRGQ